MGQRPNLRIYFTNGSTKVFKECEYDRRDVKADYIERREFAFWYGEDQRKRVTLYLNGIAGLEWTGDEK